MNKETCIEPIHPDYPEVLCELENGHDVMYRHRLLSTFEREVKRKAQSGEELRSIQGDTFEARISDNLPVASLVEQAQYTPTWPSVQHGYAKPDALVDSVAQRINASNGCQFSANDWCYTHSSLRCKSSFEKNAETSKIKAYHPPPNCIVDSTLSICRAHDRAYGFCLHEAFDVERDDYKRQIELAQGIVPSGSCKVCEKCGYVAWVISAETGDTLYCAVCDARSRHADAAIERDEARASYQHELKEHVRQANAWNEMLHSKRNTFTQWTQRLIAERDQAYQELNKVRSQLEQERTRQEVASAMSRTSTQLAQENAKRDEIAQEKGESNRQQYGYRRETTDYVDGLIRRQRLESLCKTCHLPVSTECTCKENPYRRLVEDEIQQGYTIEPRVELDPESNHLFQEWPEGSHDTCYLCGCEVAETVLIGITSARHCPVCKYPLKWHSQIEINQCLTFFEARNPSPAHSVILDKLAQQAEETADWMRHGQQVDPTGAITEHHGSKYLRTIYAATPDSREIQVDIYAVIEAYNVTCPARQHALKKLLCAGLREKGDQLADLIGAQECVTRAIEMQRQREGTAVEHYYDTEEFRTMDELEQFNEALDAQVLAETERLNRIIAKQAEERVQLQKQFEKIDAHNELLADELSAKGEEIVRLRSTCSRHEAVAIGFKNQAEEISRLSNALAEAQARELHLSNRIKQLFASPETEIPQIVREFGEIDAALGKRPVWDSYATRSSRIEYLSGMTDVKDSFEDELRAIDAAFGNRDALLPYPTRAEKINFLCDENKRLSEGEGSSGRTRRFE